MEQNVQDVAVRARDAAEHADSATQRVSVVPLRDDTIFSQLTSNPFFTAVSHYCATIRVLDIRSALISSSFRVLGLQRLQPSLELDRKESDRVPSYCVVGCLWTWRSLVTMSPIHGYYIG
jgi:hypothetical protein